MIYTDNITGKEYQVEITGESGQHYRIKGPRLREKIVHKNDVRSENETIWRTVAFMASVRGAYQIKRSINGSYSCNCLGFQFRQKCKHVDSYLGVGAVWSPWKA